MIEGTSCTMESSILIITFLQILIHHRLRQPFAMISYVLIKVYGSNITECEPILMPFFFPANFIRGLFEAWMRIEDSTIKHFLQSYITVQVGI